MSHRNAGLRGLGSVLNGARPLRNVRKSAAATNLAWDHTVACDMGDTQSCLPWPTAAQAKHVRKVTHKAAPPERNRFPRNGLTSTGADRQQSTLAFCMAFPA